MMSGIVQRAALFAEAAHAAVGQKRKYTGEPYIVHPRAVATLVMGYLHLPTLPVVFDKTVAAAFLHDVVEDTQVTLAIIEEHFGPLVTLLVSEVTDVSKPSKGNRAARKAIDRDHIAQASPLGKVIKLADLIDNTRSIVAHDLSFAKVYLKEKRELLNGPLKGSASDALYSLAWGTLIKAEAALAS